MKLNLLVVEDDRDISSAICKVLKLNRSTYYKRLNRKKSKLQKSK